RRSGTYFSVYEKLKSETACSTVRKSGNSVPTPVIVVETGYFRSTPMLKLFGTPAVASIYGSTTSLGANFGGSIPENSEMNGIGLLLPSGGTYGQISALVSRARIRNKAIPIAFVFLG